ncbi:MAG TPA: ribonucleotide-diphosphate reductase subunit beta, partial [Oceanicaulis sp.]|nr:ribonucleotide-diphosphate reductase subunit beta [Oceanicaulis sp.]
WLPEEVPMAEDVKDWHHKLDDKERNLLTQIFRFFVQADVEVNNCYMKNYMGVFKPTEVLMMLSAFSNMETIHVAAYSHLLDTIGMPETEYEAFFQYKEMKDKYDYMQIWGIGPEDEYTDEHGDLRLTTQGKRNIAKTLAVFGAFTEGLQLFASFAMLMNFPRFNKMKGMGQIVSWSVRDESLHCEGMMKLFHTFAEETGALTQSVKDDIADCCQTVVKLEDKFIDLAFEAGEVEGMTPEDIKTYIRYIADWRMKQMKLPTIYGVKEHPLPWLSEILNGVEHANFFEARATEYSKGATQGDWHGDAGVWSNFDNMMLKRSVHGAATPAE